MAEAVAAFSLAANVLQFVEFAKKVFDKGLEIHRSGGTVPNDLRDLRNAVANLQATSGQLQISQAERITLSTRYQQVVRVSDSCAEKCSEILKSLDSIGFKDERTRWGAVVTAFKATWNQKKIDDLNIQVKALSESLNVALLSSLRDYAMRSAEQQELILQKLGIVQDNTGTLSRQISGSEISWDAPGDAVIDFVTRNLDADAMERQRSAKSLRKGMLWLITGPDKEAENIAKRSCPVFNIPRVRKEELEAEFLNSFYHAGMDSRRSRIVNAHEKTLRWVFDDHSPQEDGRKWSDLREWLKSDEPLYWGSRL
ncbi:uncharacterized protein ColSpa_03722 [Colletotrichum spaethianum]|uniref:Fungal N-terminal domain-containing protein n=1 Tax=Colletotrichum spaethianum TaxID=700344 RepID=A0AA37L7P1_9PEZI|nr:uncharacterized protein ColSpa_03722 [Colletotrichum spaethianum]GKT43541.1 hypothetical protein ColSpa_03722 [Colletotrichum spaethianum]